MRSFEDTLSAARRTNGPVSLLAGNGLSIAADPAFDYRRLLDVARFGGRADTRRMRAVFDTLGTADFELAVHRLEAAAEVLDIYRTVSRTSSRIQRDARSVRRSLARTLAAIHPARIGDVGDARLDRGHDFLAAFNEVFTTNYDLLVYWAVNRKGHAHFNDGFRRRDDLLVHVEPDRQNVSWLHGGVHLHEQLVPGDEPLTFKREWTAGAPLVDQLREDLTQGRYPLIVMEGPGSRSSGRSTPRPTCPIRSPTSDISRALCSHSGGQ